MILSVFTEKYSGICRKIINSAIIDVNGNVLPVVAQWDTGATGTCISKEVVKKCKLIPIGKVMAHTPSGVATMNQYMIDLILNKEVVFKDLRVMDSEIGAQKIDVLIGMDIISKGDFAISNFNNTTQFSFRVPSQEHIQF